MENPSQEPPSTPTPKELFAALRRKGPDRLQVAGSLLDRGVDINSLQELPKYTRAAGPVEPRTLATALYDAAKRGDMEAVEFLISRGANVRARNRTGMGLSVAPFPRKNSVETWCALDGMRMSRNLRIVQLAEELHGVETEEEFVGRRDAFDALMGPHRARPYELEKTRMRRVKSVLPKSSAKMKGLAKEEKGEVAEESGGKRYNLRARKPALTYA
ncbi:hypothetical protein BDW02DRAFT_318024 [Decorospora gaudefroyi]|uniref:Uncharacterized protein n=1 Tax=Decorospora gaudefroyi TaxID=184978 RepID=A0A6A5KKN6_9PLEO|nr:hypothetical protein BDW02DRAFT_318024 [Decorospora gaudefroyi]